MSELGQDAQGKQGQDLERLWTPDEQAALAALEAGETIDSAARLMNLSYAGLYKRRTLDPQLNKAIEEANANGRRRQAHRIAKALYAGAEKAGEDARFTTAAIFALKNLDPQNFRDSHEISGPGGGAIPMQIVMFGTPPAAGDTSEENF